MSTSGSSALVLAPPDFESLSWRSSDFDGSLAKASTIPKPVEERLSGLKITAPQAEEEEEDEGFIEVKSDRVDMRCDLVDELTGKLAFSEPMPYVYMDNGAGMHEQYELIHKDYRKNDRPVYAPTGFKGKKGHPIHAERATIVYIEHRDSAEADSDSEDIEMDGTASMTAPRYFGTLPKESLAAKRKSDEEADPTKKAKKGGKGKGKDKGKGKAVEGQAEGMEGVEGEKTDGAEGDKMEGVEEEAAPEDGEKPEKTAEEEGQPKGFPVLTTFNMDSQWPSIGMVIDVAEPGENAKKVKAIFFCKCFQQGSGKLGLGIDMRAGVRGSEEAQEIEAYFSSRSPPTELAEYIKTGNVWETRVECAEPPIIVGLSQEELDKLKFQDNTGTRSEGMQLVHYLLRGARFSLLRAFRQEWRAMDNSGLNALNRTMGFFLTATNLCQIHGEMWYYPLALKQYESYRNSNTPVGDLLKDQDRKFKYLPPPRWMTEKWLVYSVDGKAKAVFAKQWSYFSLPQVVQTPRSMAFLQMLDLRRQDQQLMKMHADLQQVTDEYKAEATVEVHPTQPALYRFTVTLAGKGNDAAVVKPPMEQKLTLRIAGRGKFFGMVCDAGEGTSFFQVSCIDKEGRGFKGSKVVRIEYAESTVPLKRAINGLKEVESQDWKAIQRGLDIPETFLHAKRQVAKSGWFADLVTTNGRAKRQFKKLISAWELNPEQKKPALELLEQLIDTCLIFGPAGTGKTAATQAIVHAIAAQGVKVLVVAASNAAVDNAMGKLLAEAPAKKISVVSGKDAQGNDIRESHSFEPNMVRWKDSYFDPLARSSGLQRAKHTPVAQGAKKSEKDKQDAAMAFVQWNLLEDFVAEKHATHKKYAYNKLKLEKAKVWAAQSDAQLKDEAERVRKQHAKRYLELREIILTNLHEFEREQQQKNIEEFSEHSDALDGLFFAGVDIVYSTASASGHDVLRRHFDFAVVVIEEAGQLSVADACVPLGAHKNKIRVQIVSGDGTQMDPISAAQGGSEGAETAASSYFNLLFQNAEGRYPIYGLKTQYRQHPHLMSFSGPIFYPDGDKGTILANAPSVEIPQPVDILWEKIHEPLGVEINSETSHFVAFDTSSQLSTQYKDTTSWYNEGEAFRVMMYVAKLVDTPDETGAKISPSSICILTPYVGQVAAIKAHFENARPDLLRDSQGVQLLDLQTASQAQGNEWDIVIVSLVMNVGINNDPKGHMKIGWISDAGMLCVDFTRARRAFAIFGNFKGWTQVNASGWGNSQKKAMMKAHRKKFREVIEALNKRGLIASESQFQSLLGNTVTVKTWATVVSELKKLPGGEPHGDNDAGRGRGRGGGRGGFRGRGRGRGDFSGRGGRGGSAAGANSQSRLFYKPTPSQWDELPEQRSERQIADQARRAREAEARQAAAEKDQEEAARQQAREQGEQEEYAALTAAARAEEERKRQENAAAAVERGASPGAEDGMEDGEVPDAPPVVAPLPPPAGPSTEQQGGSASTDAAKDYVEPGYDNPYEHQCHKCESTKHSTGAHPVSAKLVKTNKRTCPYCNKKGHLRGEPKKCAECSQCHQWGHSKEHCRMNAHAPS